MCKSAYIHVPFCDHICAYCDFFRVPYNDMIVDKWLDVICQEIQMKQIQELDTLYIGGGTPSSLSLSQLHKLFVSLSNIKVNKEYTFEANVESLSEEKIKYLVSVGINRVSLGVQTFQDSLLQIIHRHHTKEMVLKVITCLHQYGIHNISIDLMYALPTQTIDMWKQDLQFATTLNIQHISLYSLILEEHSEFGRKHIQSIDEDLEADMYDEAISYLTNHGFKQYEISSFTKPNYASLHNQAYWNYDDFYGIGCGASGKENHQRYDNTKSFETYFIHGSSPTYIPLSKEDEMFEMIMMSLRMNQGLSLLKFKHKFQSDVLDQYKDVIDPLLNENILKIQDDHIYVYGEHLKCLNDILVKFL